MSGILKYFIVLIWGVILLGNGMVSARTRFTDPNIELKRSFSLIGTEDTLKTSKKENVNTQKEIETPVEVTDSNTSSIDTASTSSFNDAIKKDMQLSKSETEEDSLQILKQLRFQERSPKKAMMLSAVFPGLGQVYNHKYWKLPLLYGGFAGLVYGYSWNNSQYKDFRQAYQIVNKSQLTEADMKYLTDFIGKPNFDLTNPSNLEAVKDFVMNNKNYFRKNRDYCVVGMIAVYILNVIDASVDAHFSTFDVSDDLSLEIDPYVGDDNAGLHLNFKF